MDIFGFKYPAKNVPSILDEIERTGWTSEKPLNNVTKSFSVKHDPALSFFLIFQSLRHAIENIVL
jgi:hypothetical protein